MNLGLSGGGLKGFAYIGVLRAIEEIREGIKRISGTSIGSIVGLLICLGYTSDELENLALNLNLSLLENVDINLIFTDYGMDSGERIINLLEWLITNKGYPKDLTFKQLFESSGIHFYVTCCEIEKLKEVVFDYILTPESKVSVACNNSSALPFLWTLSKEKLIDGCFIKNLPLELLPIENTIGFYFKGIEGNSVIKDFKDYILNVMKSTFNKGNLLEIEKYKLLGYKLVCIPNLVSPLDQELDLISRKSQIESGYNAYTLYLKKNI